MAQTLPATISGAGWKGRGGRKKGLVTPNKMPLHNQGGDTPIHAVVRAVTGLISESWPRILRKGCSRYAFFRILSVVKRSMAEIQRSKMVKSLFAMRSSSTNDGQDFLTPVAALTTASMGVSPPPQWNVEIIFRKRNSARDLPQVLYW